MACAIRMDDTNGFACLPSLSEPLAIPSPLTGSKDLREIAASRRSGQLHFARITRERRLSVCEKLATLPVRAFCVPSQKTNIRTHFNINLGNYVLYYASV